ncbi:hypothetical protein E3O82_002526, partial [Enterococcus faecalis]|nr:hypothetical protein [Enterococcus faecalis]
MSKIVIFDLDGTLLDTSIPHLLALKKIKLLFDVESGFFKGSSILLNLKNSLNNESDLEKA